MDAAVQAVLDEFHERTEAEQQVLRELGHEKIQPRRDEFLFPVGPEVGTMMNLLVKGAGAKAILEIGTSRGYSTIWLAEAARETGGRVTSLDYDADKQQEAAQTLARAGLTDYVEFRAGDAMETINQLAGPFDFALLDVWKNFYVPCFDALYPKLSPGALIAADNMLLPPELKVYGEAYLAHVRTHADIDSVLLPIGQGVELSRYTGTG